MQPQSPQHPQQSPQDDRKVVVPARNDAGSGATDREAAARLVRDQIDRFYETSVNGQHGVPADHRPPQGNHKQEPRQQKLPATYARNHEDDSIALSMGRQGEAWEQYHSAWQNYYQQYYQRYYLQQLNTTRQKLSQQHTTPTADTKPRWLSENETKQHIFSDASKESKPAIASGAFSRNEVASELKSRLLGRVQKHAGSVRKSQHFMPIVSALSVGVLFVMLQYNQLIQGQVRSYVSPGSISPQNVIIDPNATAAIGSEPKLIIPKINVEAPIVYDVGSLQDPPVQKALKKGVVHYPLPGANSKPGQVGNNVILGHSTHDAFDDGQYKFVFLLLERMEVGDTFYINHEGKRYTYSVTKKEVIRPSEVGKLVYPTDKPITTLVTCVPIGTAANRLLVTAEQISPDPSSAIAAPQAPQTSQQTANIPGDRSSSLFDRLFSR